MPEFETEITVRVRVEYDVLPGERGSRDRYGLLTSPDIADDLEILAVVPLDDWLVIRDGEVRVEYWRLPDAMQKQLVDEAEDDLAREAADCTP